MSRWDALRPKNQEGRARTDEPSRRSGSGSAGNDGKNSTTSRNRRMVRGNAKPVLTSQIAKRDSVSLYEGLRDSIIQQRSLAQSWHGVDKVAIASIVRHIEENMNELPAEQVASETVLHVFLPAMMNDQSDEDSYCMLCSLICAMMGNPRFASAILAPTVKDINVDGVETLSTNPVRRFMFSALQEQLLRSNRELGLDTSEQIALCSKTIWSCRTLSTALRASIQVYGNRRMTDTNGVSATVMSTFLSSVILRYGVSTEAQGTELLEESFKLLNAYMIVHPDSSMHFVTLILPENSSANRAMCTCCKFDSSSNLLSLLHQGNREARLFVSELIQNLPLESWLQRDYKTTALRSTLSFPCRVISSLQNLLFITECLLLRNQDSRDEQTAALAVALLRRIPVDLVLPLTPDLLNLMNSLALVMERSFEGSTYSSREVDVFLQLVGGRVTPEGDTTRMSSSMRMWLDSSRGQALTLRILSGVKRHGCGRPGQRHRTVCAILRSHPKLVVRDPTLWAAFSSTFDSYFTENDLRGEKEGIALYESILQGRSQEVAGMGEAIWEVELEPLLFRLSNILSDCNSANKVAATTALSHLLPQDWVKIGILDSSRYLGFMASLVVDGTASARSELFNSLGRVVSNFYHPTRTETLLPSRLREETALCERLVTVTLQGCGDPSPSVRCMALFCLGNLCSSLCSLPATSVLIQGTVMERMAMYACRGLSDEDIKVRGNAIRSVAHALCLVNRNVASPGEGHVGPLSTVFRDAFAALARQAQHTLALLDPERMAAQTWKERQALKKLGWGSFNSLSRMFDAGIAQRVEVSEPVEEVLLVLFRCVSCLSELPEKVSLAAGACLRSALSHGGTALDRLTRSSEEREGCVIGACTWKCISLLSHDSDQTFEPGMVQRVAVFNGPKLHREAELLLKVMLENCSTSDASLVLMQFENSRQSTPNLRWLCDWMDSHGSSPQAFASFALAMDRSGVGSHSIDPDVDARFAIRAMAIRVDHEGECEGEI